MNLKALHLKIWTAAALAAATASAPGQGTNQISPTDFSAFKIISERNIFDPNRLPPRTTPPPPPPIVDSFGLYGTADYGESGPCAVFSGTHSEYHKVLETGGTIAGFTVDEIGRDAVKLSSGTNVMDLKVGMQMRRNADGIWSVAQQAGLSGGMYASTSNSRWQGSARSGRFGRGNSRNDNRSPRDSRFGSSRGFPADASRGMALDAMAGAPMGGDMNSASEPGNGEPSDPVARMMLRRQQETGGNADANENENQGEGPNPPPEPPPGNENPTPDQ